MKTFDLEKYRIIHKIQLRVSAYCDNGNLAIVMNDWASGEEEPWNVLTVNLDSACPKDCAFIDTNNNGEDILAWIERHGFAAPPETMDTAATAGTLNTVSARKSCENWMAKAIQLTFIIMMNTMIHQQTRRTHEKQ